MTDVTSSAALFATDSVGKVGLVTGGAAGIGAAVARALARRGLRVVVADIDADRGGQLAEEVDGAFVRTDVRDPAASVAAVDTAVQRFGRLDFAHLNAGIAVDEPPVDQVPEEVYRRMLGINVDGVFFGLQAAVPAIERAGGGAIVATASLAGLVPTPLTPMYALTKHAVVGLVRSVAPPLAERGIRVSAVCPGFTETAILGQTVEAFRAANFPLLAPEEVAEVVLRAADGEPGAVWPVQPGRDSEPYKFRGVPGPRVQGHEGQRPPERGQR